MKDNDIKKIFDNAIEGNAYTDINKEKIQNTVMERLGKQAGDNLKLSESGETVEPIFVTAPVKKSRKAPTIIAAAAAACLGIAAISTGFFGTRGSLITSAGDTSDTSDEQTVLSAPENVQEYTAAETLAETEAAQEHTAAETVDETEEIPDVTRYATWEDFVGEEYPLRNNSFTLLDGTEIVIGEDETSFSLDHGKADWLLSEDNGRVYYWNGKEKKDVTDLMSMEIPYIDSYENEGSGLTHYIVIGGDVASGKYGYAEVFATHKRSWLTEIAYNSEEFSLEQRNEEAKKIVFSLVETAIRQISGEQFVENTLDINRKDFKSVTLPCDR